jgi:hypothetical protein
MDLNFLIIISIVILIVFYLLPTEKFYSTNCGDISPIPKDSDKNNSSFCPSNCKASLTQDGKSVYCVDVK